MKNRRQLIGTKRALALLLSVLFVCGMLETWAGAAAPDPGVGQDTCYYGLSDDKETLYLAGQETEHCKNTFDVSSYINLPWYHSGSLTTVIIEGDLYPTSTRFWFDDCQNLQAILNTDKLHTNYDTDMCSMFQNCKNLTQLDVSGFDTSQVTDMSGMFLSCENLTQLDVSKFVTSKVTHMSHMFASCKNLTQLDVSGFDTSQVTHMQYMFEGCKNLTQLDVSGFDTSQVTYMWNMFAYCQNLTQLDVSGFDTSQVTDMDRMFQYDSRLNTIRASRKADWSGKSGAGMFEHCTSLKGGKGTAYDSSHTNSSYARVDGGSNAPGYFTPYSINVADGIQNGTVTVKAEDEKVDTGTPGEKITVTLTPEEGYTLQSASATGKGETNPLASAQIQEGTVTFSFDMPNNDVTINAAFQLRKDKVHYVDEKGVDQGEQDCIPVGSNTTNWTDGNWYAVTEDVTIYSQIWVNGAVNLILCDGATLFSGQSIVLTPGNSLTIWGQEQGIGGLTASGNVSYAGIGGGHDGGGGTVTINGGVITATGSTSGGHFYTAGIGGGDGGAGGTVEFNGGTVIANGTQAIGSGNGNRDSGSITLCDGAKVTAGANQSEAVPVPAADRVDKCREQYAKIEPCTEHEYENGACKWCGDPYTALGNLTITKTVSGGVTEEEAECALTFEIQKLNEAGIVGYLDADGNLSEKEFTFTISDFDEINTDESGCLTSAVKVFEDIPAGTYRFFETNAAIEGFRFEADRSVTDAKTTVSEEEDGFAEIIDTYTELGDLTITKTVSGGVTKEEAEGALAFEVRKLADDGTVLGYLDADGNLTEDSVELTIADFDEVVTDESGYLTSAVKRFEKILAGTYRFFETNAAIEGFRFEADRSVTDAETTVSKNGAGAAEIIDTYVRFVDAVISVSKVDIADGRELAGARIQLLDSEGDFVDGWTSGAEAYELEELIVGETYTLRETVAPEGYTIAADMTFSVDETGKVTTSGTVTEDNVLLIEDTKTKVKVSKVDIASGRELEGATIQIIEKDSEGNEKVVEEWVSTKKAHEIEGLKTGEEYTLRETVAPEGYTVATDTTFTIDKTGKVTTTGTVTEDSVLLVEDTKTKVKVSKVDIGTGEEVEGATLQILDPDGKVVEEWVSAKEVHVIEGLTTGVEFTLKETVAPEGYTIATDTTFSLDETGKVTTTGTITEDGVILIEDAKTKVKVSKVDIADGRELEGATIQILDSDGNVVHEWVSTKEAHEIEGLETGVEYTLREAVAPDGYTVATDTKFTIDETGKVTSTGTITEDGILLVEDARTYEITFVNWDGTELQSGKWAYGQTPEYTGEKPTKPATAQYTYTFKGWDPEIEAVTGKQTYTATYSAKVNEYEITFVNWDGTELQSGKWAYGETPAYTGEAPTKPATAQYTYKFKGWDPEIEAVTGNATYTAVFESTLNHYKVTWVIDVRAQTEDYAYGEMPQHAKPTKSGALGLIYIFKGWSPAVKPVTGDAVYTAVFEAQISPLFPGLKNTTGVKTPGSDGEPTPPPSGSVPGPAGLPFIDVFPTDSFYDDVKYVFDEGIMNGISSSLFDPYGTLTRGMVVTILYRIEGSPDVEYNGTFTDVPDGEWFTDGVEWAASKGIVNGYGNGKFGPTDEVTREQLAAILYRYAGFKGYDVSIDENTNFLSYNDVFEIAGYAKQPMFWAIENKMILDTDGDLRPAEAALRWEVALAIRAFCEKVAK